jgi:hypothetical protein
LSGLLNGHQGIADIASEPLTLPYADLGPFPEASSAKTRSPPIFVTARFRTGSTLLWNLFRHLDGVTAYYEPLNERRWFDPSTRGGRVDPTHPHVTDYWTEYEGLPQLGNWYHESWCSHNLYMDADFWNPDLKRFIEILIQGAKGRPVLQFNRMDFRLGWLRHTFPDAIIVHLYRHPRDQWVSTLVDVASFPKEGAPAEFARQDRYYLLGWAKDLRYHFPFLDERRATHPYQLFYYIWRLSYLFGRKYADVSLALEDLVVDPRGTLDQLFANVGIAEYDLVKLASLVEAIPQGKWRRYAEEEWFRNHEAACELVLRDFFSR